MAEATEEENNAHMQRWGAYMGKIAEGGNLVGGMPLMMDGRLMNNGGTSSDVVKSEAGEAIGGWLHFKANDYEHAVELAKDCPIFEYEGNIEVREVMPMEM